MAPGAIRLCEKRLHRGMAGLEWGSGRSTLWFGRRLGSLVSIEGDPAWHANVTNLLARAGLSNVECRLVPVDPDIVKRDAVYWNNPPYVAVVDEFPDEAFDFIAIDGHYRQATVARAPAKLKSGGLLLVDNTDWLPRLEDWFVPADWPVLCHTKMVVGATTIWKKP